MRLFLACFALAATLTSGQPAPGAQPVSFTGVQPQLAKSGDRVFLVYGQDNVITVRSSADGGLKFGAPVTITVPGRVSLGMHRGPRIAATPSAVMVTVIAGAKGGGADGDLLLYRSTDNGATFGAPVVINDVAGAPREGLHGFAANDAGFAILAWLDLREKGTRIYSAVSRNHGATWSADEMVYTSSSGSVCECCHPSVAPGSGSAGRGRAVMFRNNLDGNRDLYVTRSVDGTSYAAAQKSGLGSWKLDACPMDGGAVVLNDREAVSVWRRENDVYLASPGKPEQRLGAGRDPVIDRAGQHQDIAWSSPGGLMLRRDGGAAISVGEGRFPTLVALAQRTVLAWESQGAVKVLTVAR